MRPVFNRDLGLRNGVTIPLHPCEHYYVVTEKMEGVHPMLPVLRDPDCQAYVTLHRYCFTLFFYLWHTLLALPIVIIERAIH